GRSVLLHREAERLLHDERAQALDAGERLQARGRLLLEAESLGDQRDIAQLGPRLRLPRLLAEVAGDDEASGFARREAAPGLDGEATGDELADLLLGEAAPVSGRQLVRK